MHKPGLNPGLKKVREKATYVIWENVNISYHGIIVIFLGTTTDL